MLRDFANSLFGKKAKNQRIGRVHSFLGKFRLKRLKRLTAAFALATATGCSTISGLPTVSPAPPLTPPIGTRINTEKAAQECCNMSLEKLNSFLRKITPEQEGKATFQQDICIEFFHPTNTEYIRTITHNCVMDVGKKGEFGISVNVDETKVGWDYNIGGTVGLGYKFIGPRF